METDFSCDEYQVEEEVHAGEEEEVLTAESGCESSEESGKDVDTETDESGKLIIENDLISGKYDPSAADD